MSLSNLPYDIIYQISLYIDAVKYRNGTYMYQISKTDERYQLLQKIPNFKSFYFAIYVDKTECGLYVYLSSDKRKFICHNYNIEKKLLTTTYNGLLHKTLKNGPYARETYPNTFVKFYCYY